MDRTTSAARRLTLLMLLGTFAMCAPACSRMKTYRGQDSPLPGIPLVGRKARAEAKAAALARKGATPRSSDVAWSGPPSDGRPIALLDSPKGARADPARQDGTRVAAVVVASKLDAPDPDLAKIRTLIDDSRTKLAKMTSYQVAMHRQERVGSNLLPAEDVLLCIRREPRAVRLEWPAGPHKGREVLYSASEPDAKMHINMADSVLPVPRMSLAPDSPLVMKNSRHPITEAGLDAILETVDGSLKPHEEGTARGEQMTYDGIVTPPELGRPCHKITRVTAEGHVWTIDLDTETGMPALVQEMAANGDLIEKYVFRDLKPDPPALAEAAAFDPAARWGPAKGLFGRFAQGAAPPSGTVR